MTAPGVHTDPETVEVAVRINARAASALWWTASPCLIPAEPERFEPQDRDLETGEYHVAAVPDALAAGMMYWAESASCMLLLAGYEQACGYDTMLLWDTVADDREESPYVVLTSRPWPYGDEDGDRTGDAG